MFTYIVPTIFKSEKWKFQTNEVAKNGHISKIYIIVDLPEENNIVDTSIFNEELRNKIEVLHTGGGAYCNGAWNFAMKQKIDTQYIIFANDDILFDTNVINIVAGLNLNKYGIIGCGNQYKQHEIRPYGFGQLMFMDKNNYYTIPEGIKHYFGDDWIIIKNQLMGKSIFTIPTFYETNFGESSSGEIVKQRILQDMEWWKQNHDLIMSKPI
jgi:hypothetical protein